MFVDLTKAFDTVNRPALWKILTKFGCPEKFVRVARELHDNMMGRVIVEGGYTIPFPITTGVKQGCVLAPTLFGLFFAAMLSQANFSNCPDGVYIRFRRDGDIFDIKRLHDLAHTSEELITELLYADDCALVSHSEEGLQAMANALSTATKMFGLTISLKKTEVMFQPAPGTTRSEPSIKIENTTLNVVNKFKYLGSIISDDCSIEREINNRIRLASDAFGRLRNKVWNCREITLATKLIVYQAIVISVLLYGCETWS